MKSRSPIVATAQNCPPTLDGGPDRDFFIRFGIKPGGSAASIIADCWLDVFEGSTRLYGIAPAAATVKVELAEGTYVVGLTEYSMQDRVNYSALEDSLEGWAVLMGGEMAAVDIWRELMTPMALSRNPL